MLKILIVEDDRELRRLFAHVLIKNGYTVKETANGNEALDAMDGDYYDLIISDVMMPVMDGYELVRMLRDAGNNTPVLMITAKDAFDELTPQEQHRLIQELLGTETMCKFFRLMQGYYG